jgi:cobyrinic acid a,c-diamide synthase
MLTPKAIEAWFTLMAEASRGSQEAQPNALTLPPMSANPEAWQQWMSTFMPGITANPASQQGEAALPAEAFEESLENWWRMMGVVPRSRYLELLEKHEQLQRKLEKAAETIKTLQAMLSTQEKGQQEVKKVMDIWGNMLEETAKTQSQWMQTWAASNQKKDDA